MMLTEIGVNFEGQRVPVKPVKTCWISKYGRDSVFIYLSLLFGTKNLELVEISVSCLRSGESESGDGLESYVEFLGSCVPQGQAIAFTAFVHLRTPTDDQSWSVVSTQVLFAKDARPCNYDQRSFQIHLRHKLDALATDLNVWRLREES